MEKAGVKVLVTGGVGFIGSNLVDALLEAGHTVTIFDNLSLLPTEEERQQRIKAEEERGVRVVRANLLDEGRIDEAAQGQDVVFHLAAQKYVDESLKDPINSTKQNVVGLVTLLHSAVRHKVKKVFLASSAAVYGYNDNFPLKESETPDPRSPYALEKVVGEQYLKLFYNLHALDSASLRFFNVYGPNQYSKQTHCGGVTIVMHQLKEHGVAEILGDGSQTRDMVYVGDVVAAMMQAMLHPHPLRGEIFNVCTNTRVTVKFLQESIAEVMGLSASGGGSSDEPQLRFKSLPFAEGNVVHSQGDNQKAKDTFGFEATTSLQEGLQKTWAWFQQNPSFYSSS
ncbi:UDP-glucose 4-epimerase [Balamuthia mandrillaris]